MTEASSNNQTFQPGSLNDASSTIRGFYYQVALTALAVLNLKPGESVRAEYGEDIDVMRQGMMKNDPPALCLIQAKYYAKHNLSLKSEQFQKTFCHAFMHLRRNPAMLKDFIEGRFTFCLATASFPENAAGYWADNTKRRQPLYIALTLLELQGAFKAFSKLTKYMDTQSALILYHDIHTRIDDIMSATFMTLWMSRFTILNTPRTGNIEEDIKHLIKMKMKKGFCQGEDRVDEIMDILITKLLRSTSDSCEHVRTWDYNRIKTLIDRLAKGEKEHLDAGEEKILSALNGIREAENSMLHGELETESNDFINKCLYDKLKQPNVFSSRHNKFLYLARYERSGTYTPEERDTILGIIFNPKEK